MELPEFLHFKLEDWRRTLYILFIAQLMTAVGFAMIFPFLPLYVQDLGSTTNLSLELLSGLVYSAQAFTMMLASPIWGALADRVGRKIMVERAMFGGAILLFLMALVTSAEQLVLLRAVQGAITGTIAAANALIASKVPKEQTGFAMGLLQVGFNLGIAIGPMIGGPIADQFGYHAAFYVTAVMLFLSGILVLIGIDEHFTPAEKNKGRKMGIFADWKPVLSAPGVSISFSLRFLSSLGRMMIIPIVPLFIQTLLVDSDRINTIAGLASSVVFATTTISAIYLGRLGDRIGHRKIVIVSALVAALLYLPQGLVNNAWHLILLQAMVGISLGGIIPSLSALLAKFSAVGDEGTVYGLDNSINSGGRTAAPLLGSAIASAAGYQWVFPASAGVFLITGIIAMIGLPRNEFALGEGHAEG